MKFKVKQMYVYEPSEQVVRWQIAIEAPEDPSLLWRTVEPFRNYLYEGETAKHTGSALRIEGCASSLEEARCSAARALREYVEYIRKVLENIRRAEEAGIEEELDL